MTISETDPDSIDQHKPGAHLDAGKPRAGLVLKSFGNALLSVSEVGTYGARKYSERGWLEVMRGEERYLDSAFRHLLKMETESLDSQSELDHLAHAAWNLLASLELKLRKSLTP